MADSATDPKQKAPPKKPRRRRVTLPAKFNSRAADSKIAALATGQHGLVTRAQAIALGMSPTSVKTRVRRGRWEKLHRGVYVIAGAPKTRQRDILAACLAVGPDAVAASFSAAELHRLPKIFSNGKPIVAAPHSNKVRCPGRRRDALAKKKRGGKLPQPPFSLRHRRYLDHASARALTNDVPVTSVAWTYVELAAVIPERRLELSIAEAMRRGLLTAEDLAEAVVSAGPGAHVARLRRILAGPVLQEAYRSLGEIILRQQLRDEGHADAVMNKPFFHGSTYIGSPDATCESARVLYEVDGPSHAAEAQRSIDRIQTACYEALAWAVVRLKPAEVGSRSILRARTAAAEERRRRTPVSHAEFRTLWQTLTAGLPPTHVPSQAGFPTAFAQYL